MSELALFNNNLPDYLKEVELDAVTKALAGGGAGSKRISLRGSKFRMVVNGDEVMTSKNEALEVVIVNAAKDVSRQFYGSAYNPKADATPPDCWSNDGIAPDKTAKDAQHSNCAECPQNIKGSGQGESRACRHFRRLAVSLANDVGGDVYQLQLASKSIFGKGDLDHMPFEQYAKYVGAQGYNLNTLVTEMRFDADSDTAKLFFKPVRFLQKDEWETAKKQGDTPSAKNAISMTVAQVDGVKAPKLEAPKAAPKVEKVEAEEVAEPTKRAEKKAEPTPKRDLKAVMGDWSTDDE
jgi:hypothetical protein